MTLLKRTIFAAAILFAVVLEAAPNRRQTREEYVDRYKQIAIDHMERYGIPASITMAQGILESDCGNSLLSQSSNNHFGIKCKKDWRGRKVYHDDDAKGECFRAYPTVEASYEDHARFLDSQPRYDSLFAYSSTDYRSWARGLKAAGYATAPDYAERLVRIIEESHLYLLDKENGGRRWAMRDADKARTEEWFVDQSSVATAGTAVDPDNYRVTINAHKGYNIYSTNGVHYILAKEGDTFEALGKVFRLSPKNLRRFNDLKEKTAQPMTGEVIYIGRKKNAWEADSRTHTARRGETAYAVAQTYGIRMKAVEKMNRLTPGMEIAEGTTLKITKK